MELYQAILFGISAVVFITYFCWIWLRFGIQSSISESFRTIRDRSKNPDNKWIFTFALWGFSLPLAIVGAEIHPIFWFAAVFILFVGAAPKFWNKGQQHLVHMVGAVGGISLAMIGFFILGSSTAFIGAAGALIMGLLTWFDVKNTTWWVETTAFVVTWIGLFVIAL